MLFAFLLLLLNLISTTSYVVNDLSEYTVEEFDSEIEIHECIFVKFFTPSCPYCQSMAGDFVKTARDVKELDPPCILAEVDCTSDIGEHVCHAKQISGYPTLKLYRFGAFFTEYTGSRDRQSMTKWLKNQNQSKSRRFNSYVEMDAAIRESNEVVVAGVFNSATDKLFHKLLKTSRQLKQKASFENLVFYHTFMDNEKNLKTDLAKSALVLQGVHIKMRGIVLWRPKWMLSRVDQQKLMYYEDKVTVSLTSWITSNFYGIIGFRTKKTGDNIHNPLKVGRMVVVYLPYDPRTQSNETAFWKDQLVPFAQQFTDIKFVISKTTEYYEHLKDRGLTISFDPPVQPIVIAYDNLSVPYVMRKGSRELAEFVENFRHGHLESSLKTIEPEKKPVWLQQESITDDGSKIKDVTAKNFSFLVSFTADHVLLLLYKNKTEKKTLKINQLMDVIQTKFDETARKGVSLLRMNCTENEVPPAFNVQSLPKLYFIHAKTKTASRFKDKIHEPHIIGFMDTEATKGGTSLFVHQLTHEKTKSEL